MTELKSLLVRENTWCALVFPKPKQVIKDLISQIFSSLQPSLRKRLEAVVDDTGDQAILALISEYKVAVDFGQELESIAKESDDSGHALFQEFLPLQQKFGLLEEKYMLAILSSLLKWDKRADNMELSRIMLESLGPFFKHCEGTFTRCNQFTAGFGAVGAIEALSSFWQAAVVRFSQMLTIVEAESGISETGSKKKTAGKSIQQSNDDDNDFEISKNDFERTDEWDNFQVGLRILGVCCTLKKRLDAFENSCKKYVLNVKNENSTLLDSTDHCTSSYELLKQSILNSFKLNALKQSHSYFPQTHTQIQQFTLKTQAFVFNSLFFKINQILSAIPQMDWTGGKKAIVSPFNIEMPQFSHSPSTYITRIGEFLLTLPQQLDLYADDEALWFSISTLPYFNAEMDQELLSDAEFCTHLWISCVSRGAMEKLVDRVLEITDLGDNVGLFLKNRV